MNFRFTLAVLCRASRPDGFNDILLTIFFSKTFLTFLMHPRPSDIFKIGRKIIVSEVKASGSSGPVGFWVTGSGSRKPIGDKEDPGLIESPEDADSEYLGGKDQSNLRNCQGCMSLFHFLLLNV